MYEDHLSKGKLAFAFPGQGSQVVGMGEALCERHEVARRTFERADEVLGYPLAKLCFEGPAEELRRTENAQPAILTTSVAVWRVLCEQLGRTDYMDWGPLVPDFAVGHSLGEFTALVCAGALPFEDAVQLVHERGRFMQEAVPEGEGAMAALTGIGPAMAQQLCEEVAGQQVLTPAALNGELQTVVAGHAEAVERCMALAATRGGSARRLNVSAPFHCALMRPAAERLRQALAGLEVADLAFPVVANVDGAPNQEAARVKQLLVDQVTSPVLFDASVRQLARLGVTEVFELGPGQTLTKLIGRIDPTLRVTRISEPDAIEAVKHRVVFDLEQYTEQWREGGWMLWKNGIRINEARDHLFFAFSNAEWRRTTDAASGARDQARQEA